ncbi:class I SAM-dependent DNA methyltransferase [Tsukamurella tyrosinosolvens]|uniref:DNA methyltransferase n=1 Tax=Tsukamurella TaxID=2060 RepID=UPI000E099D1E|nr:MULTISPECIES: DNA methyltransferase [Tsukamurella]MCA4997906.1 class I SAM-dependent DNA methyltransferase [Tsukamurella tyrosinosolvens]RDH13579.1 class I SAM-dependent DNA methyltransferase [Tsukamurella pulmonis]
MARLNLKTVEERVAPLGGRESYDRELIFDLLLAYGKPQGNVTRLRKGSLNVADDPETEVAQKNVVYFKETTGNPLAVIDELKTSPTVVRYRTRFVVVTDYTQLLAVDTKTGETLMIPIREIDKHFTFFLPWAGMEKAQYVTEAHADVKAADRMGKLFDELLAANPGLIDAQQARHGLNVFFARLLFCFFAEDTEIFADGQFTNAVGSHTQPDGSDVDEFLTALFKALDTETPAEKPNYLAGFPYVNGRLFTMDAAQTVPTFTKTARQLLIDLGNLNWSQINPDIFGSMFQAVVNPHERSNLGQHYTSVPNILKTIEPLFLDGLREQLDSGFDSARKLEALLERISAIKVFDPACGSGNFLVIAYKELRKLEHAILERLAELDPKHQVLFAESKISIENFYGIELADFATEVAILSMWIAKHQMNTEFKEKFNLSIPLIPLKETGQIQQGNATRVDWNIVCPNDGGEIYLIGNPPYYGAKRQTQDQKDDYPFTFGNRKYSKNLNYIALWFEKGADYIEDTSAELAFVTTKTVAQGEHVGLMFPSIFDRGLEIGYTYPGFQWENNAKKNADVTVAVIGIRKISDAPKYIYDDGLKISVENINGYLAAGPNVFIMARKTSISNLPPITYGSMPNDGGGLILSSSEHDQIVGNFPGSEPFVKKFIGASEYLAGEDRFALWIDREQWPEARKIAPIKARVERVRELRRKSDRAATRKLAEVPYRFGEVRHRNAESIMIPINSSGLRDYIPIGYLDPDTVISNTGFAITDTEPWLFSVLTSAIHMAWVNTVCGRARVNYKYSNTIVYNNFPVPSLSERMKERLTVAALRVLDVREYHCEKTLAELYDPDLMPEDLRTAHAEVDALVDSLYSKRGYETDEQRLSDLFAMYEAMTAAEAAQAPAKRPRGTKK